MNDDDWKDDWNAYLREKFGSEIPEGPLKVNLGDIKFFIPPLLGIDSVSMKAIKKHNAKYRIFS